MTPLRPVLLTPPATLPVSLAEVKARLRIDHDDEDADLGALLAMAVAVLDGRSGLLGRCLMAQTWRVDLARFPLGDWIVLPFDPVISIASVSYIDPAGDVQTLTADAYTLLQTGTGPALHLTPGFSWPSVADRPAAVSITVIAGYGNDAEDVPGPLRHAILTMVADYYSARESYARGGAAALPAMVPPVAILRAYKRSFVAQV